MPEPTRRRWLRWVSANLAAAAIPPSLAEAAPRGKTGCTLSIGTYSMKGLTLEKAIPAIAELGYDGIEITVAPGFDGVPGQMSATRRKQIRKLLGDRRLRLTALMENLSPAVDHRQHRADLARLRRVLDLAHDLSRDRPPLIQTVLGGGKWEAKKNLFRDRVGDWLAAAVETKIVLAVKPHRGGAMSRPGEAIWLIEQLKDSPFLRMVYDYSHYAFRDMPLEETIKTALPYTAHIAVKDAVQRGNRVEFVLPGESGTFDYPRLLRLFHDGGYRGDVCCEVSSMVSGKPNYDAVAAAKTCYQNLAPAFKKAGVPRSR